MSEHTKRFLDGFWTLFIVVLIVAALGAAILLGVFVGEYWHTTRWGVYTVLAVAACYLLGWLIEVTS